MAFKIPNSLEDLDYIRFWVGAYPSLREESELLYVVPMKRWVLIAPSVVLSLLLLYNCVFALKIYSRNKAKEREREAFTKNS